MLTEPKVEWREAQNYVGIRTGVTVKEMGEGVIPHLLGEGFAWLERRGVAPSGAPFMRFHVIDMESKLDVTLGLPVANPLADDGVCAGILPAGRYASLIYTGTENGIVANKALLDWGATKGLVWDTVEEENGDGFGARLESYLTGPEDKPDPAKWETEVAIRLADAQGE